MSIFLSLYAFWILYLAITNLQRAYKAKTLKKPALILGYPVLFVGLLMDVAMNLTLFSLVFWEFPKHWLVTQRLTFHIQDGQGWRNKLANWLCINLLNAFDVNGNHCS